MIKIALIGCGAWGYNIFKNLILRENVDLVALCDINKVFAGYKHYKSIEEILLEQDIDAVIIATPASTHEEIAIKCLEIGLHVLIEKPMTTSVKSAERIKAVAGDRVVMVGHTFLYNPAVWKLKEYIIKGEIGNVYYIYSRRLNLGRIRKDVNALWNFAPHDISIILYLLDSFPISVSTKGKSYLHKGIEDVVFLTMEFPNNVIAHVHVSWLDPCKVREMTVVGSKKMIVYDDISSDAKLKIYDKGAVNNGDLLIPRIEFKEPLSIELSHFIECIETGRRSLTDIDNAIQVIRILEDAQRNME